MAEIVEYNVDSDKNSFHEAEDSNSNKRWLSAISWNQTPVTFKLDAGAVVSAICENSTRRSYTDSVTESPEV